MQQDDIFTTTHKVQCDSCKEYVNLYYYQEDMSRKLRVCRRCLVSDY